MLCTEEVAKTKICQESIGHTSTQWLNCCASRCMAWVWDWSGVDREAPPLQEVPGPASRRPAPVEGGDWGLHQPLGKPPVWRLYPMRGRCGKVN